MSYLVLARKYRPKTFDEVVGQEVMTGVVRGALREERIAHAYLFCGPRGTGKTTTARILAKAMNCEKGPTAEPCGECERCVSAEAGTEVDIIEIDAASNRGIDDIRALRNEVAYTPMRARFKVYIIDEVHMLTGQAFNALLKTLEEPPPHVKFLLATTDPHKVPDTVLSRCQVLHLSLLPEELIAARLSAILELEGVEPENGVTQELARIARGSLRDGLSATDQLLALGGSRATLEDVHGLLGEGGEQKVIEVLRLIEAGDRAGLVAVLPPEGVGAEETLLDDLLSTLRVELVAALAGRDSPLAPGPEDKQRAELRFAALGADRLQLWLEELLHARERSRQLPQHARLILELCLLDLARPESTLPLDELERRLVDLEARLSGGGGGNQARARVPADTLEPTPAPARARTQGPARERGQGHDQADDPSRTTPETPVDRPSAEPQRQRAARRSTRGASDAWRAFLESLATDHKSLAQLLERRGKLVEVGAERALVQLSRLTDSDRILIEDQTNRRACDAAFSRVAERSVTVTLEDTALRKPGERDEFTRSVADLFGGTIEDQT